MLFYILFLFSISGLFLLGYFYPNKNKFCQWLVLSIVIFIAGFRDRVGADYDNYVVWYTQKTRDNNFEYGFVLIMDFFRSLNLSYHYLFFFFSFFTYFFFFLGLKKYTTNFNLAFLIFLLLPGLFLNSLCYMRQSFAMTIGFYAFYFLINKKYYIYILLMAIGISIHITCVMPFFVFYIVYKYADRIKVTHLYFILIISLIISQTNFSKIFNILFQNTRYTYYLSGQGNSVSFLKIVILNVVAVFVLLNFEKMKNKYEYQKYLLVLYILSVVVTNIFASRIELTRFSYYFKIFETVVIADLIFLGTKERRLWLITGFYFYYLIAFMYSIKVDFDTVKNGSKFTPYKNLIIK